MTLALISSAVSALCMALMIITDRILMDDFYRGKANQAWFISSAAGSILGLVFTILVWVFADATGNIESIGKIFKVSYDLLIPKGLWMIFLGALSVQTLLHYLRCFAEKAHSAAVAAWLAATPIFVYGGMLILTLLLPSNEVVTTSMNPVWVFGVFIATTGLIAFEKLTSPVEKGRTSAYRRELSLMILFTVFFMIGIRQVSGEEGASSLIENLALLPYYWVGFAAGTRVVLQDGEWGELKKNWLRRLKYFIVPILLVELIGMMAYWFEYLGLSRLDPALVSIIAGTHVFIVYFLNLLLAHAGERMRNKKQHKVYFFGIRLLERKMPRIHTDRRLLSLEIYSICAVAVGIAIATYYTF